MYKLLTVFIGCLLLLSCREQQKAAPFFEGYVEYNLKAEILDTLEETRVLVSSRGVRMTCYMSNGDYLREYYDVNNVSAYRLLYKHDLNSFFHIYSSGDIYKNSAISNTSHVKNIQVIEGAHSTILGYDCPSMKLSADYIYSDGVRNVSSQYFFCKALLLDTSVYMKITSGGYNKAIAKYPYVAIQMTQEAKGHYKEKLTATRIVPIKVRDSIFALPLNRKIVDL